MIDLIDPTISGGREQIAYAQRPRSPKRLRIGLIENTKRNSEVVLRKVAERLAASDGMTLEVLVHKPQRSPLKDAQVAELKGRVDLAITGVGD